ncbi:MAG TPA: heme o synthase [Candidatus Acidoferrales bacterium]|nr:heme o synthase [Candidatus Acidoferrales bacterium]
MSLKTATAELAFAQSAKRTLDFLELTKPRIVLMVLITTAVGFYLGSEHGANYVLFLKTLAGTALAAGGTLALNQFFERDIDARMERTRHRPLPDGRIQPLEASVFGVVTTLAGLAILLWAVNSLSALVAALIVVSYLCCYTPLKQKSSLCGPIGALPGALPPVVGWVAASGALQVEAWVLFGILFLWQVPHTLAIATLYREDFERAGIRFLPVVEPDGASTGRQSVSHSLALLAVSLLPTLLGLVGGVYFFSALLLGSAFVACSVQFARRQSSAAARKLLWASLVYLPVLLVVMALDSHLGGS